MLLGKGANFSNAASRVFSDPPLGTIGGGPFGLCLGSAGLFSSVILPGVGIATFAALSKTPLIACNFVNLIEPLRVVSSLTPGPLTVDEVDSNEEELSEVPLIIGSVDFAGE